MTAQVGSWFSLLLTCAYPMLWSQSVCEGIEGRKGKVKFLLFFYVTHGRPCPALLQLDKLTSPFVDSILLDSVCPWLAYFTVACFFTLCMVMTFNDFVIPTAIQEEPRSSLGSDRI